MIQKGDISMAMRSIFVLVVALLCICSCGGEDNRTCEDGMDNYYGKMGCGFINIIGKPMTKVSALRYCIGDDIDCKPCNDEYGKFVDCLHSKLLGGCQKCVEALSLFTSCVDARNCLD